jgi:3-oxoacyl-[acyl-carrier-protein] synthase-3
MFKYTNLVIRSIYASVPKSKIDILSSFSNQFGHDKVSKFINNVGIKELRVSSKETTSSDFAFVSAKNMMDDLKIDRSEIGFLILVTQTPDYLLPSTSFVIHKKLNLPNSCIVFDINLGCSGYVHSLNTLFALMNNSNFKYGIVLTGDTITKIVNPQDSSTAMLFGDAGTATLIEKNDSKIQSFFTMETISDKYNHIIVENGLFRNPGNMFLHMNGIEVFNFGINEVSLSLKNHITKFSDQYPKFDFFVPHQANLYMLKQLKKTIGDDIEMLTSLELFGNTSVSSIPLTIAYNQKQSFNNKKILMSGFGVGFSIASASLEFDTFTTKVIEV